MSIALEVCRIAEATAGPGAADRVVTVAVDVGEDAGVEISSLAFCLETLLAQPPFTGARPVLNRLSGDALRVAYLEVDDGRPND